MKRMKFSLLALVLFVTTQFAFAQHRTTRGHDAHPPLERMIEHLEKTIDLSDEQTTQLQLIVNDYQPRLEALKSQDFETREAKREALKAVHEDIKAEIDAVLTPEQIGQLEAIKKERQEKRAQDKEKMKAKHKAIKAELEAYNNENVTPVLLVQRAKLEDKISEADKATIDELRVFFEAKKQERAKMRENGERPARPDQKPAELEIMKALLEKYQDDIKMLMAEIEDQRGQWQEDMKEIKATYAEDTNRNQVRKARKKQQKPRRKRADQPKAAYFLLLDPAASSDNTILGTSNTIASYPNPSSGMMTLAYEIKDAGLVRIDIQDESGNVVQTILNEQKTVGSYSINVNTGNLKSGAYYFTLSDAKGKVVEKVLITQ